MLLQLANDLYQPASRNINLLNKQKATPQVHDLIWPLLGTFGFPLTYKQRVNRLTQKQLTIKNKVTITKRKTSFVIFCQQGAWGLESKTLRKDLAIFKSRNMGRRNDGTERQKTHSKEWKFHHSTTPTPPPHIPSFTIAEKILI